MCCPSSVSYELPHADQALVQVFLGGPVLRRHTAAAFPVSPDLIFFLFLADMSHERNVLCDMNET